MAEIKIEGLKELIRNFGAVNSIVLRNITASIRTASAYVLGDLKKGSYVPVKTGKLKTEIREYILPFSATIRSEAKYSGFVHWGTKPHIIRVKTARVLANRETGQIFGPVVHHPGTKAQPFMDEAVERTQERVKWIFEQGVEKITQELVKD